MKPTAGTPLRNFVRALVRFYFPRIEVTGRERLPDSGPVLFVANHPNSLVDPVIIGIAARRPVHFLAKAPLFELPIVGPVLRALGMVPAYRGVDDPSQVARNTESLAEAAKFLAAGDAVGIFPEGKSHDAAKVDKVRSGAGRIAVSAFQLGSKNLQIVPIGINFERKDRFRSAVWVCIGRPIGPEEWPSDTDEKPQQAVRLLTREIDRRLKEVAVHLVEDKWEPFLDELELLVPSASDREADAVAAIRQRKRAADAMNYFLEADRPRAEAMANAIAAHRQHLAASGIDLRSPSLWLPRGALWFRLLADAMRLALWAIPAAVGVAHHIVPFVIVRAIARWASPPGKMTVSTSRLLIGLPLYAGWYALASWWLQRQWGPTVAWTWTALMPAAGLFALSYCRVGAEKTTLWWHELQLTLRPGKLQELRHEHLRLREHLGKMAAEFRAARPAEAVAS